MFVFPRGEVNSLLSLIATDLQDRTARDREVVLGSQADWFRLLECASKHGLVGLLYRVVATRQLVPAMALAAIRKAAETQTAGSCYLANELLHVLNEFAQLGIPALAIKGPVLASRAYGRLSDREFCDLDVLVHPADIAGAGDLLKRQGYRVDSGESTVRARADPGRNHIIYLKAGDLPAKIELHWSLNTEAERAPLQSTGIWLRAEPVMIAGEPVMTLSANDTLVYLCIHGFKHRWCRLKWVADIAYLLRFAEHIDWAAVLTVSRQVGCRRMLLTGVGLASSLFGTTLPAGITDEQSRDPMTLGLLETIRTALLSDRPMNDREALLYDLQSRERFRDHAVVLSRVLKKVFRLTGRDVRPEHKPARSQLAAALNRPRRLYREYGLSWLKPLFRVP